MKDADWLFSVPVAHRGLYGNGVIENTIEAFSLAVDKGYNVELDVQLTKDGQLVVFHDENIKRMMGVDINVRDLTYAELNQIRFLASPTAKVPLFSEVCELCEGKVGIMIEVKKEEFNELTHDVEDVLITVLEQYEDLDYIVKSFNPFAVDYFREKLPKARRGFLSWRASLSDYPDYQQPMVERLLFDETRHVDFFDYQSQKVHSELFDEVFGTMPIILWTVTSQEEYEKVRDVADNIIFERFIPKTE